MSESDAHSKNGVPKTVSIQDSNKEDKNANSFYIVGIGASAGGLEAIESFFNQMSPDSNIAFVVIQHLSPDYKSLMVELLSKKTEMPVYRAEEGMVVQPNSVYLIPPKKNLRIFHGKLLLSEQEIHRVINLPIDIFLRSLAEDLGEKAIGIILSGTGSDGMRGVRAIKEAGGMVVVQSEESAKFDGMPRSAISTGLADYILPPEEMPEQLLSFIKHPYVARDEYKKTISSDEDGLARIFSMLREKSKVDFTFYKSSTIIRRIERRMSVNQIQSLKDYVAYLERVPREVEILFREFLIGVTSFFRDQKAFETLKEKWLPDLLLSNMNREIRFWVAGCSTGEEAYSLAILCQEVMEVLKKDFSIKIFATDVDNNAILSAGNGQYPESIAADLTPKLLAKYFTRNDDNFFITRKIREMVVFAEHNLVKDPPFTNIDLISCRNLLIYLQPILQHKVLELINFSLNKDGILFLGTSETIGEMTDFFIPLHQKWRIYRSRGQRKPMLTMQELSYKSGNTWRAEETRIGADYQRSVSVNGENRLLERFLQIADSYLPFSVIVNLNNEIIHVIGDSDDILKLPSGRIYNDITKMARKELAIPLATGIQKAYKNQEDVKYTNIRIHFPDKVKIFNLHIKPLPEKKGQDSYLALFFEDTVQKFQPDAATYVYDIERGAEQRIADLEQELQFTRESLQATIEELETSNEELQATNEELIASNEELQSTNEELQSVNEELYTVNSQYQSKIIELTELNNDIDNLILSTRIGFVFLDENLGIRKYTPEVTKIYNIIENDIGRPFSDLTHQLQNVNPGEFVHQVQNSSNMIEQEVITKDGNWYLMRVIPYCIGPKTFSGVVIAFLEINNLKTVQTELQKSERRLKEKAAFAKIGSWEYFIQSKQLFWSEETYILHGVNPEEKITVEKALNFYAPKSKPIIKGAFDKILKTGKSYDLILQIITQQNNPRWIRTLGMSKKTDNKITSVFGVVQDVTELMEMKADLQDIRSRYRYLFANMSNGVLISEIDEKSGEFIVTDLNPATERITKISRDSVLGKPIQEAFPVYADAGLTKGIKTAWETNKPTQSLLKIYKNNKITLSLQCSVFKLPAGEIVCVCDNLTDKNKNLPTIR